MQIEAEVGLSAAHSSDLQVTPGEKIPAFPFQKPQIWYHAWENSSDAATPDHQLETAA